jgi:hypothetical protein
MENTKQKVVNNEMIKTNKIKEALANYMQSEGCSCCQGSNHDEHKKVLAELLNIPMYKDKSGYNFNKFATNPTK